MRRVGVGLLVLIPGMALAQGQPTPLIPPSINYQQGQQDQTQPGSQDQPPAPIEATPLPPPSGAAAAPPAPAAPPAEAQGPGAPPPEVPAPSAPAAEAQGQAAAPPAAPEQHPMVSQWPNKWVPQTSAVIRVLNKVDAISRDVTVKVGQTGDVGSLSIEVQACVARPPDEPADAAAFLVISDGHKDEAGFRGWSLAVEPWVSMLQNPVYNVRVIGCS